MQNAANQMAALVVRTQRYYNRVLMTITNHQLRRAFLNSEMLNYFRRKLPGTPPSQVIARIEECLKFLNIATFCRGNIPVTQEIDDIWHYWILETMDYKNLCQKLTGRSFIHHRSNDYQRLHAKRTQSSNNPLEWEVAMLSAYVINYGPFKADRVKYWWLADHLVTQRGWSVKELNNWLNSET
jgi:hypothetical protein